MSVRAFDGEVQDRVSSAARLGRLRVARVLFIATVLSGATLMWIAPRPPLCDLPQHAAQVALLRDLIAGTSPWASIVRVNFFTPYLAGPLLTLLLSHAMPIPAAFKVLLTGAYLAFTRCAVLLRKHFRGDERLDWLFIPGFFGFAFAWGFITYLVAAPIGLLFILFADRYALAPSSRRALGLVLLGVAVFFSHGLVFLFACAVGALMLAIRQRRIAPIARAIGPYLLLGALAIVYAAVTTGHDVLIALANYLPHPSWGAMGRRPSEFVLYPLTSNGSFRHDPLIVLFALFMFAAPWILGDRLNPRSRATLIPFAVIVAIYAFVPDIAMKTAYLYQRFAVFILATYALMFRAPVPLANRSAVRETSVWLVLMCGTWIYLGVQAVRMEQFAAESARFETILDAMAPGQRALSLIFLKRSDAYDSQVAYMHYPLWYQAERHGFVDMNFAWFIPEIVRLRAGQLPAVSPNFELSPQRFDWKRDGARKYRYFVVRDTAPLPAGFFANDECEVKLVRTAGDWSLYERGGCGE
ncbi:hypothetical protein [Paraburkholderia phosphatilytica]|uniref:hypothetical protein n=1 Tax=Paraburkholderia phosphatilytica TaxID=2282883 RepID=UPI000E527321|nr:hypothetical protein [Paraburkholderia phosphatilytica]